MLTTGMMTGWQLGLRLSQGLASPLENLLEARLATISFDDSAAVGPDECFLVATFDEPGDLIIMDAVGSWLLNFNAADAGIFTRRDPAGAWQEGWRAIFGPYQASARIWIAPTWADLPKEAEYVVRLESSLAFGGGGHPTTRGILNVLDKTLHDDGVETVLDAGSGSGILALAAGRLGCRALGIDNEKAAVDESLRNLAANELGDRVEFRLGRLNDVQGTFDLVAANIYGSVLRAQAKTLRRLTRGHLLLTGFYEPMAAQVIEAYPGMTVAESFTIREWTVLHLVAQESA